MAIEGGYWVWWLSGDECEPVLTVEFLARVGSAREGLAVGDRHALEEPEAGGHYRLVDAAGSVLAKWQAPVSADVVLVSEDVALAPEEVAALAAGGAT